MDVASLTELLLHVVGSDVQHDFVQSVEKKRELLAHLMLHVDCAACDSVNLTAFETWVTQTDAE